MAFEFVLVQSLGKSSWRTVYAAKLYSLHICEVLTNDYRQWSDQILGHLRGSYSQ